MSKRRRFPYTRLHVLGTTITGDEAGPNHRLGRCGSCGDGYAWPMIEEPQYPASPCCGMHFMVTTRTFGGGFFELAPGEILRVTACCHRDRSAIRYRRGSRVVRKADQ